MRKMMKLFSNKNAASAMMRNMGGMRRPWFLFASCFLSVITIISDKSRFLFLYFCRIFAPLHEKPIYSDFILVVRDDAIVSLLQRVSKDTEVQ
jgi:hypothetical protein